MDPLRGTTRAQVLSVASVRRLGYGVRRLTAVPRSRVAVAKDGNAFSVLDIAAKVWD